MDRQKLLLKVAQLSSVEEIKSAVGTVSIWLRCTVAEAKPGVDDGLSFSVKVTSDSVPMVFSYEELQEAIDKLARWKDAPNWANWLAMDEDGRWTWFKNRPYRPYRLAGVWCERPSLSLFETAQDIARSGVDWEQTLEARPVID